MSATLDELFPFEYSGGGYFRRKGVPKGDVADILHGMQAVGYLYAAMIAQAPKSAHFVTEYDGSYDGDTIENIVGAWFSKEAAEQYAANQNGGSRMGWGVTEVEIKDRP